MKGQFLIFLITFSLFSSTVVQCRKNSLANRQATYQAVEILPGERVRAIEINKWPAIGATRAVQIKALRAEQNTGLGRVDAIEFVMTNVLQTALSFGYFGAVSQVPTQQDPDATKAAAAAAFWLGLRMFHIFEYVEGNGVEGFQLDSADNITGGYDLSHANLQWQAIQFSETQVPDGNGGSFTVKSMEMETVDEVFFLRFSVAGRPVKVDGFRLNPDQIKVDFAIRWFDNSLHIPRAWTTGPSAHPNARVGITAVSAAVAGVAGRRDIDPNNDAPSFVVTSGEAGEFVGVFSWANNASVTVQGATFGGAVWGHIVNTANDPAYAAAFAAGWLVRIMAFSFEGERPAEVYWDPLFGAELNYDLLDSPASVATVSYWLIPLFSLIYYLW